MVQDHSAYLSDVIIKGGLSMQRLQFLKQAGGYLLAGSAVLNCSPPKVLSALNGVMPACSATSVDALGPFYIENTKGLTQLNVKKLAGIKMSVVGRVFDVASGQIIKAATIEVWHADSQGRYHPEGNGDFSEFASDEINLRGVVKTNEQGQYQFNSIYPGLYASRPRHIHFKISAVGYNSIITQSYFKNDSYGLNIGLAQKKAACLIVEFELDKQDIMRGEVNFFLQAS